MHIIEVFKELYINRKTGILRASNERIKKSFYFIKGELVFAHSNLSSEKIGQTMVSQGLISKNDLNMYLAKKPKETRLGMFLLNQGLINSIELESALTQQVKKICFSAFKWQRCNMNFEDKSDPIFPDLIIKISTPDLIIEGIYQVDSPEVFFSKIPNFLNCNLYKGEEEGTHLPRSMLNSEETLMLSLIEEKITVRDLLSKSNIPYKEGLLMIYSLYLSGLINFIPSESSALISDVTASIFPDLSSEEKINEYIEQIYPKLYKINYYDLLCVEPSNDIKKIHDNYDYFMDRLQPIYYHSDTHKTAKSNLKYIIDYFSEAFDVLSNEEERKEYDRKLKEGLIEERPHPDSIAQLTELPTKNQEYSFEIHPVDSSESEKKPTNILPQLEDNIKIEESPPPPTDTLKYAEYLFRHKKYNEVLNVLKNIESSQKKKSLYHFLMGATLANYPDKNKEAEEFLLRAYTLEPKNSNYLLHLGLFYKSIGLGIKAFRYLNEVLKIDPNNLAAKEALGLRHTLLDD